MHYMRLRRHGDLNANDRGAPVLGTCSVDGCNGPAYCKTLCHGHYSRLRRGAPLDGPIRPRNTPTGTHKKCPKCDTVKDLSAFAKTKGGRTSSWCKECLRYGRKKMYYGLSRDQYDAMIAGGCSVCGSHERLHVDHNHATGAVRGILCSPCNVALGYLRDDPERIDALAAYARHHS